MGPELVEGDQLLLEGVDQPCDGLAGLGQSCSMRLRCTVVGSALRCWASLLLISARIRAGSASRLVMWFQTTVSR